MQSQSDLWSDRWRWLDGHHFWHRVSRCASSINSYDKSQIGSITAQFQEEEGGRAAAQPSVRALPDGRDDEALMQPAYESAEPDQQPGEEEFEVQPHAASAPTRPNYNLRRVLQRLPALVEQGENERAKRLLLGYMNVFGTHQLQTSPIFFEELACLAKSSPLRRRPWSAVQFAGSTSDFQIVLNYEHEVPMCSMRRSRWICSTGSQPGSCCWSTKQHVSRSVAPSMDRSPSTSWRPSWNSGFTTLGLLNVWCLISKWHWWAMTLVQNLNAWESTVAHAVLPLALAQSSTLAQASCRGMSSWPSSRCSSSVQNFNDKVYSQLNLSLNKKQPWPRTWLCPMVMLSIHGRLRHHASGVLQPWLRARDEHRRSSWDRSDGLRTGSSNQTDIPCTSTTSCHWRQGGTSFKNKASPIGCWRACGWNLWSWILQGDQERPRMEGTSSFTTPWCWWRSCHHTVSRKALLSGLFATHPSFPRHLPHGGPDPSNGWCTFEAHEVRGEHVRVQGVPLWLDPQTEWVLGAAAKTTTRPSTSLPKQRQFPRASQVALYMVFLFGRALRSMEPPAGTIGTLITWIHGGRSYSIQEHKTDNHLRMKRISNHNKEDICVLYFFYYIMGQRRSHPSKCPSKEGEHRGQAWRSWNIQPNSNGRRPTEQKTRRPRITHCDSFSWEEAKDCLHQERDRVHAALVQRHNSSTSSTTWLQWRLAFGSLSFDRNCKELPPAEVRHWPQEQQDDALHHRLQVQQRSHCMSPDGQDLQGGPRDKYLWRSPNFCRDVATDPSGRLQRSQAVRGGKGF